MGRPIHKARGFEVVSDDFRKTVGEITIPQRATEHSIAYDFFSPIDVIIQPNKNQMIWTDVKSYFFPNEALLLNVRSSMGKQPVIIANIQGWIESDYYSNESNDGNIGFRLLNLGDTPYIINAGDKIGQGMFINYLVADSGNTDVKRTGGFGSTTKKETK
jgi:dUTP pyrophosphatase